MDNEHICASCPNGEWCEMNRDGAYACEIENCCDRCGECFPADEGGEYYGEILCESCLNDAYEQEWEHNET